MNNYSKKMEFYIVDVFAKEAFTGNQVAVVKCHHKISEQKMQQIAREMNFSETSFLFPEKQANGGYEVRIFTPQNEVSFSGHPTLGSTFIINQILEDHAEEITLNLKCGEIPVEISYCDDKVESLWMEQMTPFFSSRTYEPILLSKILGLELEDIDTSMPIQEISTGLPFIIVPIKNLRAMEQIRINKERYSWLVQRIKSKCILAFCLEPYHAENNVNVRVFADALGIPEDPATGSGNGCLAAYLAKYKFSEDVKKDFRIEQGYQMGRPSLILAQSVKTDEKFEVKVGGQVILVAEGKFLA